MSTDPEPIEAMSLEVRVCKECDDPTLILYDDDDEPICYLTLTSESLKDFIAAMQRIVDGKPGGLPN